MSRIPLRLGPLQADGCPLQRSGVVFLRPDGYRCRPNEVIAYCNIGLAPGAANPFLPERDLQVALAPRMGGRLHLRTDLTAGGHLDGFSVAWDPDDVLGWLETDGDGSVEQDPQTLRLLLLAGRRVSALASGEAGLLPGWHDRRRSWWFDARGGARPPTLLTLGICDAAGPIRGDKGAFTEAFETAPGPAHIVLVSDNPVTPCAPVLVEQALRTPAQIKAIEGDLRNALLSGRIAPTAEDWFFAGLLLSGLTRSPISDRYPLLTSEGLVQSEPAETILLSLNAEFHTIQRHRELGYALHVMRHYKPGEAPAMQAWLNTSFENVRRTIPDIKRDYERLIDVIDARTRARVLVINRMSTEGQEDILSYASFDAPMAATLETIAAKELNLMLHDIAEDRDLSIIDVDALAAELGGGAHLPDGTHQSGLMQAVIREEIFASMGLG